MKYETVIVRQVPDDYAVRTGLAKYKRSKMPQTMEFLQVAEYGGRYITGIDEDGLDVQNISDPVEREEVRTEKQNLRESLSKMLGKDLSATSTFWEDFGVKIHSDQDLVLNMNNPLHVVMYHVLISNRYAAPDFESTSAPEYLQCKYYCHVESKADMEEVSTQKLRDKAGAELFKMADNPEAMVLVGQYLEGDKYKSGMTETTLYKMLSAFIKNVKEPDNLKKFLKATSISLDDLQFKIAVDRAVKRKLIVVKDNYWQRGQVTLGRSLQEVHANLKKPEFATEFLSIQQELEELA